MMRIYLLILVIVAPLGAEPLRVTVASDAVVLMNAETGAVLFEKNAHKTYYPASITKIATALHALKKGSARLDEKMKGELEAIASISSEARRRANYKQPPYWLEIGSSHIGIKNGEIMTFRDLLYGMMVASGNDAANVIAQNIGGTIPQFVTEVNAYVKELGCEHTNFLNPHGVHHPDHKTTAYDMALITREALKDPVFAQIVSTTRYTRPKTNKQEPTILVQTNRLLRPGAYRYAKAIGVKTGYTSNAQSTLVAAARHEGRTLIAVMLHCKDRNDTFRDAIRLFDAAFNQNKAERVLLKAGPQKFTLYLKDSSKPIQTYLEKPLTLEYYPAEEPKVKAWLYWDELKLPIVQDQRVGEMRLMTAEGQVLQTAPLYATQEVRASFQSFFQGPVKVLAGLLALFCVGFGIWRITRKN